MDENMNIITYSNNNLRLDLTQPLINYTGNDIENISIPFSALNGLSIIDYDIHKWHPSFIDRFSSILCAIQFTSLNIFCNDVNISTLLEIIKLLPNIDSLRIESFPRLQLNELSAEDTKILDFISKNNKITKVWQNMSIELTEFIFSLCSRLEHYEVIWIPDTDIQMFLQFILFKSIKHIPHLKSLRLLVLNANDQMIEQLKDMINMEKLLSDYLIKRCGDNIYLRWK